MEKIQTNSLGEDIILSRNMAMYDEHARRLASFRSVLARILKHCCDPFKTLDEDEIMKRIQNITITGANDERDLADTRIIGLYNETELPGSGKAVFDLHFLAKAPGEPDYDVEINLELNNGLPYHYHVLNRAMFNSARMIAEQGGTVITDMKYNNMMPVYSIFIIFDAPQKYGNLICETETKYLKRYDKHVKSEICDKLNVRVICLPKDNETEEAVNKETELTGTLRVLFSEKLKPKQRIELLWKNYGLKTSKRMAKEMNIMCNLSEAIAARGISQGRREGISQGRREGISEGITKGEAKRNREIAVNMLAMHMTTDQISQATGLSSEEINQLKN